MSVYKTAIVALRSLDFQDIPARLCYLSGHTNLLELHFVSGDSYGFNFRVICLPIVGHAARQPEDITCYQPRPGCVSRLYSKKDQESSINRLDHLWLAARPRKGFA